MKNTTLIEKSDEKKVFNSNTFFNNINENTFIGNSIRKPAKYESLLKSITDENYSVSPYKNELSLSISTRWQEWTGFSLDDILKDPKIWVNCIHSDDFDGVISAFRESFNNKCEFGSEYRIINKKTDVVRYIREHSVPIFSKKGEITRYDGVIIDITELKITEKLLWKSENYYQTLIESLNEGIWVIDENSYTTFVNPRMAQMLQYNIEEILGKHLFSFMDEEGVEICKRNLERRHRGIKELHDFIFLKKNGSKCYVLMETAPLYDDNKKYIGAIASVLDVTENRIADEQIKDLLKFPDENPNPHIRISKRGLVIYSNKAATPILSSLNYQKGLPINDKWYKYILEVLFSKINLTIELEYENRYYSITFSPDKDSGYVNVYGLDITPLKQAENELKDNEEKYRTITETAADGIFQLNRKGDFVFVNNSFAKMFGYLRIEILGNNFSLILEPSRKKEAFKIGNQVFKEKSATGEFYLHHRSGYNFPVQYSLAPIFKDGEIIGITGIIRNITEIKKIQNSLSEELEINLVLSQLSAFLLERTGTIENITTFVLDCSKSLTMSEYGYVGIIDEENGDLISYTINEMMESSRIDEKKKKIRFPKGPDGLYPGLWGHSLNKQKGFFTNNPKKHISSKGIPKGHIPLKNLLSVPAIVSGKLLGQIIVANNKNGFTDKNLETLKKVADVYALAIQQMRNEEKISELARITADNPNPVIRVSEGGAILYKNDAAIPILNAWGYQEGIPLSESWHRYILKALNSKMNQFTEIDYDGKTYSLTFAPVYESGYVNVYGLDITERKQAETIKYIILHDLNERMKELHCLYTLEQIIEKNNEFEDIIREFVNEIPHAWQYPNITCARITVGKKKFATHDFQTTEWGQRVDIISKNKSIGCIEVYYLEEKSNEDEDPFMQEESDLINAIADRLGRLIEQKNAEANLRESEDRFRSFFEISQIGMAIITPDKTFLDINNRFSDIFGYTREAILKKTWPDLTHPDDLDEDLKNFNRVLSGEIEGYSREKRFIRRNSEVFYAELSIKCIRKPDGSVSRFFGLVKDISERKLLEETQKKYLMETQKMKMMEALKVKHDQIISIFESMPQLISIVDPTTHQILYANKSCKYAYKDSLEGEFCYKRFHNSNSTCAMCRADFLMEEPNQEYIQWEYHNNILKRDFMVIEKMIRWPDNKDVKLEIAFDISNKIKLEGYLRQSSKMEAIGQLAGGIAHDFNNILTAFSGNLELMNFDLQPDDPLKEEIDELQKITVRAANLTKKLLTFSRKQKIKPVVIDINEIISSLYSMLSRVISEDIKLKLNLQSINSYIYADISQIEQIIMNLVVNARDAIDEKNETQEKRILIQTENINLDDERAKTLGCNPGSHVSLSVSDTGTGMTQDMIEKIFEPFFTSKKDGKGTGLGLSIVYGIVKQNKAGIYVYSELGVGSSFKIYWPNTQKISPQTKQEENFQSFKGLETILYTEDDENVRKSTSKYLRSLGYTIIEASNGVEALNKIVKEKCKFDILITDVTMPLKGGYELAEDLVKIIPNIKIIFVSGYIKENLIESYLKETRVFLEKPYSLVELAKTIRILSINPNKIE